MLKTAIISYNLNDRGRQYRGRDRHYDIAAIVRAINSPACQEKVHNRDMLGYYGHWPRVKFGLDPVEGALEKGRPAIVEPALVTTFLEADSDGTVRHQAEFLETDSGKIAQKLFESKTGGFSSAIDERRPTFYGFDYVLEPNYTTNRGYTLDSVEDMTLEDVEAAIYGEQLRGMLTVLDSVTREREAAADTIERLREENEELMSMLMNANGGVAPRPALDSVLPAVVAKGPAERMRQDAALFNAMKDLPKFVEQTSPAVVSSPHESLYSRLLNTFRR